jgi:hypothetical protein
VVAPSFHDSGLVEDVEDADVEEEEEDNRVSRSSWNAAEAASWTFLAQVAVDCSSLLHRDSFDQYCCYCRLDLP